jgi:hypothetical protein
MRNPKRHILPAHVEWAKHARMDMPNHFYIPTLGDKNHISLYRHRPISLQPSRDFEVAMQRLHAAAPEPTAPAVLEPITAVIVSNLVVNGPTSMACANKAIAMQSHALLNTAPASLNTLPSAVAKFASSDQRTGRTPHTRITARQHRSRRVGKSRAPPNQLMTFSNGPREAPHRTRAGGGSNIDACIGLTRQLLPGEEGIEGDRRTLEIVNTVGVVYVAHRQFVGGGGGGFHFPHSESSQLHTCNSPIGTPHGDGTTWT